MINQHTHFEVYFRCDEISEGAKRQIIIAKLSASWLLLTSIGKIQFNETNFVSSFQSGTKLFGQALVNGIFKLQKYYCRRISPLHVVNLQISFKSHFAILRRAKCFSIFRSNFCFFVPLRHQRNAFRCVCCEHRYWLFDKSFEHTNSREFFLFKFLLIKSFICMNQIVCALKKNKTEKMYPIVSLSLWPWIIGTFWTGL